MNPLICTDVLFQSLHIRGIQLGIFTILQQTVDDRMHISQFFQNFDGSTSFFPGLQVKIIKKDLGQLFRRINIKCLIGIRIDLLRILFHAAACNHTDLIKNFLTDMYAFLFHLKQNMRKRHFQVNQQFPQLFFLQFLFHAGNDPPVSA